MIIVYTIMVIATFVARLHYLMNYEDLSDEESILFSVLYSLFWPIGFLYSIIFKFFRWLQ